MKANQAVLVVGDKKLVLADVITVAKNNQKVTLTKNKKVCQKINASSDFIDQAVASGQAIYGVTTGFGGMANKSISPEDAAALQEHLIWFLKAGAGQRLAKADVRAAMLLRMNSHTYGASAIRYELIERMAVFLNEDIIPHVYDLGSIGASGDLVPLAHITGALFGLDEAFKVDYQGKEMSCIQALKKLGLPRLPLKAKEGLAMVNGTSVMTAIATNCLADAYAESALALSVQAMMIQALGGTDQSFHPFIHQLKPHAGQVWSAEKMIELLENSKLSQNEMQGEHDFKEEELIQDRYSIRCLPQYLGPVFDGLHEISKQVEVEVNSATDNPLIDAEKKQSYHGGNFLGQYIGVGMDRLRYLLGLVAKHLDTQIALLVAPEFNGGLPASLVGNVERKVNMGLKGLQISGNSIAPLITFYGNSLADRYATHAEQFNQNINSLGFGSANLARTSLNIFKQYLGIALIFAVQAVELKTYQKFKHYDASRTLSPKTKDLYIEVKKLLGSKVSVERPLIWNDNEQSLDVYIAKLAYDLNSNGSQLIKANDSIYQDLLKQRK